LSESEYKQHLTAPTEVDLGSISRDDLRILHLSDPLTVYLPLPSFGRTNSLIDICADIIDVSWAAEKLSECIDGYEFDEEYLEKEHRKRAKLTLKGIQSDVRPVLLDCWLALADEESPERPDSQRWQELRQAVADYEDAIDGIDPRIPEIVDWYHVNLVLGANHEFQSEAPEYLAEQIAKYPERQAGFFRSAFSGKLGADSYMSENAWIVPISVDIDKFFEVTKQPIRLIEFTPGEVFTLDGQSYLLSGAETLHFPMSSYFKCRACTSLARTNSEQGPLRLFEWKDAAFTFSPDLECLRTKFPDMIQPPFREACFVHRSGSMIFVEDGTNRHYLYNTAFLNQHESKQLNERLAGLSGRMSASLGIFAENRCNWTSLSDEDFERLCYDLIYADPKFDLDTIQKMGKSRSRDGGRDIVVWESKHGQVTKQRKWIFQCKLVSDGSSLTGSRLTDVGDMLDQYEANGFGVMTSAIIDSTLYDKLNAVCRKRGVAQQHLSVLELERRLARYPGIRARYFPDDPAEGNAASPTIR
jgi:hypothetical protein